jgi:hypothetical protein
MTSPALSPEASPLSIAIDEIERFFFQQARTRQTVTGQGFDPSDLEPTLE